MKKHSQIVQKRQYCAVLGRKIGRGNMGHVYVSRICMLSLNLITFIGPKIEMFIRADGHG